MVNQSLVLMIMKRKLWRWRWTITSITTKRTTTSHHNSLNIKMTTQYDVENSDAGLEQAEKRGGVKPVNVISTSLIAKGIYQQCIIIVSTFYLQFIVFPLWCNKYQYYYYSKKLETMTLHRNELLQLFTKTYILITTMQCPFKT